ncbi:MAG: methyltransferase domain-containing protein [Methylococcaceae bacterium]|nr:methyltransferase domain-containing protein [Methylococcaceae bacterium]
MGENNGILMRTFGHPKGVLGRLGGFIMARSNRKCADWVIDLVGIQPNDRVLEVGFGPGVGIQILINSSAAGLVAGVDSSGEMLMQAASRNRKALELGRVDLRHASVERLPFAEETFEKALAINSMQVWSDPMTGLHEVYRVMKPGGRIALGFTPYSGQANCGVTEMLTGSGFMEAQVVETDLGFCALANKP